MRFDRPSAAKARVSLWPTAWLKAMPFQDRAFVMELVNLCGSLLFFDDREIPRTERQRVTLRDVASIQQIRTSAIWITRLHLCTRVVEVIVHALAHTVHAMGYVYRGRF